MTPIALTILVSAGALLADTRPPGWAGSFLDWPTTLGQWFTDLPQHLATLGQTLAGLWWPWVPLLALAAVVGVVAVRSVQALWWRRVAAGGYWVQIIPPRTIDPGRWGLVWRRLDAVAVRARRSRWHVVRPPLAFEVVADSRGLKAGLWLPGWVPLRVVTADIARAWPGATVHRTDPPTLDGAAGRWPVAGVRLATDAYQPETGWLVDNPRPRSGTRRHVGVDADLGMVFAALGDPDTEGADVLLVQVLVRPAPARRVKRLAQAAHQPMQARPGGMRAGADALLWLLQGVIRVMLAVLDVFLSPGSGNGSGSGSASRSRAGGRPAPDLIEREAMAEARAKLRDKPHLLAAVRVFAAGGRRASVRQAARSTADGFGEASRWLRPVRLRRARTLVRLRRARSGEWLLLSADELGVLAHLPPDPALYRFDTAAVHRPFPGAAPRAQPEAGWTRQGWTDTSPADDPDDEADDDIEQHFPEERYEYE